jgi:hypothetical protein
MLPVLVVSACAELRVLVAQQDVASATLAMPVMVMPT